MKSFSTMLIAVLLGGGLALGGQMIGVAQAADAKGTTGAAAAPPTASRELRIRNNTPFVITVYIAGVRAGWIRPFRTERFRGLKLGQHQLFASSEYGAGSWGPTSIQVPGVWNVTVNPETTLPDMDAALASRIFRSNKSSLVACDRLAERRGEQLRGGRAEFYIKVNAAGEGVVSVTAEELGEKLLSCYRAVSKQWSFPKTGTLYQVSFMHLR